jgi:hypothetical protein
MMHGPWYGIRDGVLPFHFVTTNGTGTALPTACSMDIQRVSVAECY